MMVIKIKAKPLVWEPDGEGTIIAYNGDDGPFQIDYDPENEQPYQAQRNSLDGDCQGEEFDTLEEAKTYCQKLQNDDVEESLKVVVDKIMTFIGFVSMTIEGDSL